MEALQMKKQVELAKKFLDDNDSVTLEELEANEKAAWAAYWVAAEAADEAARAAEADWASRYAVGAAARAFRAAESDNLENAEYYKKLAIKAIAKYEELTK